jgi:hypothetical protein
MFKRMRRTLIVSAIVVTLGAAGSALAVTASSAGAQPDMYYHGAGTTNTSQPDMYYHG